MRVIDLKSIEGRPWIDFSSLKTFMSCPRQYYWRNIQHVTSAGQKPALINGSAYHECKAKYYTSIFKGADHTQAMAAGIKALVPIMKQITVEDPKRNLTVATNIMLLYMNNWGLGGDKYRTVSIDGIPLIEVPFAVDFGSFILVGKIDRVAEDNLLGVLVEETKTTTIWGKKWPDRVKPNCQMDTYVTGYYALTGEMPYGACLDLIHVHDVMSKVQIPQRYPTKRSMDELEAYVSDLQEHYATITSYKNSGIFPRNTETCIPLLGYGCEYPLLCSKYPNPHEVDNIELSAEFVIEEWAPFTDLLKMRAGTE